MNFLAVIGKPVAYSKSPLMFNPLFEKHKIDCYYTRVASIGLDDALETMKRLNFRGFNSTMPYKKELLEKVDYVSNEASKIEGVNTVVFEDGLKGFNTDWKGAVEPVLKRIKKISTDKVLVVGAGGAGRAALYGFGKFGCNLILANRNEQRGKIVAEKFKAKFVPLSEINSVLTQCSIIVYTLPVKIDMRLSLCREGTVFFSAIYKENFYGTDCGRYGLYYIGGEEWLIEQGKQACRHFGFRVCEDLHFTKQSKSVDKIAFIGFMASGKSTLGREFALKKGYEFVDLDKLIEEKAGIPIKEIFERHGESYFRALESEALEKVSFKKGKIVLSSGGGIVGEKGNVSLLKKGFFNVFLYGNPEDLYKRTDNSRPLKKDYQAFESLYSERLENYLLLSDLILNTSNKTVEQSLSVLLREF